MSDNVQMVQSAYQAFGRGDIPGVMENFADDIEWHAPPPLPQAMDARGPEEVGQFFQKVGQNWSDFNVEVDAIVASDDRVCAVGRARGNANGTATGYGFVHSWQVRDGKLARFDEYVAPQPELLG
jgi:ketosteroid isomerase-like protein